MNRAIEIWNSSILGRVLTAICLWFSGQWQRSRVVRAFVAPMAGRQAAESSVFFRLWDLIRGGCAPCTAGWDWSACSGGASFCA